MKICVSPASLAGLGLSNIRTIRATTCYLMTETIGSCQGNCSFCSQSQYSIHHAKTEGKANQHQLSRLKWPPIEFDEFIQHLKINQESDKLEPFQRICLQCVNYGGFFDDVSTIVQSIHEAAPNLKISAAVPPLSQDSILYLHDLGLDSICISLDGCNPEIFSQIKGEDCKGPYRWEAHWAALRYALEIFGEKKVTTHLIVGVGETDEDAMRLMSKLFPMGINPALFRFTPTPGTLLEHQPVPPIERFRKAQLIRGLLQQDPTFIERCEFEDGSLRRIRDFTEQNLQGVIQIGDFFKTSGCPDCNRPYYTTRPGMEHDGFPYELSDQEKEQVYNELKDLIDNSPQE